MIGSGGSPLGLDLVGLYMELDGTFPHHMPNPLIPENLVDARRAVVSEGADVFYHMLVGLLFRGLRLRDVQAELARRFGTSGHAEKAARPPKA